MQFFLSPRSQGPSEEMRRLEDPAYSSLCDSPRTPPDTWAVSPPLQPPAQLGSEFLTHRN